MQLIVIHSHQDTQIFFDRLHKCSMFEARLENSSLLKKLFDAVKELCKDVRFDCNENGIALQAMDRYARCYHNRHHPT